MDANSPKIAEVLRSLSNQAIDDEIESYFDIGAENYPEHAQKVLKAKTGSGTKEARTYFIKVDDALLPLKAVARMAQLREGVSTVNANSINFASALRQLGYDVQRVERQANYIIGNEYSRKRDIHAFFGGQQQGGISTPSEFPYVFIFTGKSGEEYGYEDGWQDDGVFLYTGEGQVGDMTMTAGNKAIAEHVKNGKEILLFEALGKGKPCRFEGKLTCLSWDEQIGKDKNGDKRKVIRFHLVRNDYQTESSVSDEPDAATFDLSLEELRDKALRAASAAPQGSFKSAKREYRKRSQIVKSYVLRRANGICELTGKPAPFKRKDGSPYLEVHHTRRLSDDGLDHPSYVGAICPTVHREIHFGEKGDELNEKLISIIQKKEEKCDLG